MSLVNLPKPFFVLAPMDEVTDTVFRQIVADCAPPDLYFTEFVNVDGLLSPGRPKLLKKLRFTPKERPLIAQLWGLEPKNFEIIARQIADGSLAREICMLNDKTGSLHEGKVVHTCPNFSGIDLNMGCPAKSEVQNGTCSALIKNRPLASKIIKATQKGAGKKMPVSVKTRLGFNEVDLTWLEFLLEHNLSMLTIHGRTRKQMSKVPADWDLIGEVSKLRDKISPKTLIVGNGDIKTRAQGLELAKKHNLDGLMIGRGVFDDPFVFTEKSPWPELTKEHRLDLFKKHVELFAATWQNNERPIHTLNKFCKIYISGFEGAKELRERLMAAESTAELLELNRESLVRL
jgi:tRNA-dihydrouridine synthase